MKLRNVLGVAIAAALLSSTAMTFAAEVPSGTNWGRKTTKKMPSFGFITAVRKDGLAT